MIGMSNVVIVLIFVLSVSLIGICLIDVLVFDIIDFGVFGLLGIDMLQDYVVMIDFDIWMMVVMLLWKCLVCDYDVLGEIVIWVCSLFGQLVVMDVYYGLYCVCMILDIGMVVILGNEVLCCQLSCQWCVVWLIEFISVIGGILRLDYMMIDQIVIGDLCIQDLLIVFVDVVLFKVFGLEKKLVIMFGMDVLRMFCCVDIDFVNCQVWLVLLKVVLCSQVLCYFVKFVSFVV